MNTQWEGGGGCWCMTYISLTSALGGEYGPRDAPAVRIV